MSERRVGEGAALDRTPVRIWSRAPHAKKVCAPRYVVRAVLFVVTLPSDINIADITAWLPKALNMAH